MFKSLTTALAAATLFIGAITPVMPAQATEKYTEPQEEEAREIVVVGMKSGSTSILYTIKTEDGVRLVKAERVKGMDRITVQSEAGTTLAQLTRDSYGNSTLTTYSGYLATSRAGGEMQATQEMADLLDASTLYLLDTTVFQSLPDPADAGLTSWKDGLSAVGVFEDSSVSSSNETNAVRVKVCVRGCAFGICVKVCVTVTLE